MITFILGTKAQYIKTTPIMLELRRRNVAYNFVDTGQHSNITPDILKVFGLGEPDVRLTKGAGNVSSFAGSIFWFFKIIFSAVRKPRLFFEIVFQGKKGVCVIHGDTASTILSLILAKRFSLKVAHIEAGLKSESFFNPFPEEIIRSIVSRNSDLLFAPGDSEVSNLKKLKVKGEIINTQGNTGRESLFHILKSPGKTTPPTTPYILVTLHRFETIRSKKRLEFISRLVKEASSKFNVLFVLHEPTRIMLEKSGLMDNLKEIPGVEITPLQNYPTFLKLLEKAEFVMTDGGSIQEECFYLGKPCLILREKTERLDGLGENARLLKFNHKTFEEFLNNYQEYGREVQALLTSPSKTIVEKLSEYA